MIEKDWMTDAAREIAEVLSDTPVSTEAWIRAIIARHCPFKPDVTYEPVNLQTPAHVDRHATNDDPAKGQ